MCVSELVCVVNVIQCVRVSMYVPAYVGARTRACECVCVSVYASVCVCVHVSLCTC